MEIPPDGGLAPQAVHSECGLSSQNQSLRDESSLSTAGRLVLAGEQPLRARVFRGLQTGWVIWRLGDTSSGLWEEESWERWDLVGHGFPLSRVMAEQPGLQSVHRKTRECRPVEEGQ